jgi:hypothetical protein
MALFADRGAPSRPAALDYNLGNLAPGIKHQLFHKSDGSFLLTLYQDVDSYDRGSKRDIAVRPMPVQLALARASRIDIFTPSTSAAPVRTAANARALAIPVGDQVTVVRIAPA